MKAFRSAANRSGRSQCGLWPGSGYTRDLAPGIAAARRCCSWVATARRVAPHQQHRRRDPPQVGGVIERGPPSAASRHTGAGSLRLSATSRSRNVSGRGRGRPRPGTRGRSRPAPGRPRIARPPGGPPPPARAATQPGSRSAPAGRPAQGGSPPPAGRQAAPRVPDQGDALDPDGVQERHHVGGEVVDPVAAGRALGVAVATLVGGVGVVAGGQQRQDPAVGESRVGNRRAGTRWAPRRGRPVRRRDLRAGGKPRGGKPRRWTGLLHGWPPGTSAGCDRTLILRPRRRTNARRLSLGVAVATASLHRAWQRSCESPDVTADGAGRRGEASIVVQPKAVTPVRGRDWRSLLFKG